MKNKKLALILYSLIILTVATTSIIDIAIGGILSGFYAMLSVLSFIFTIFPLWITIKNFNSSLKEEITERKIIFGWLIFLFCIPTNFIVVYMNIYDTIHPSQLTF